jgi:hypothetical protein
MDLNMDIDTNTDMEMLLDSYVHTDRRHGHEKGHDMSTDNGHKHECENGKIVVDSFLYLPPSLHLLKNNTRCENRFTIIANIVELIFAK